LSLLRLLSGVRTRLGRQPSRFIAVEHHPLNSRNDPERTGPGGEALSRAFFAYA
jgi:hypothetical protein